MFNLSHNTTTYWLCIFVLSGEDEIIPRYMQLMVDYLYHFICEKFQEVAAHHAVRLSAVNLLNKTNLTFRFYFYQICRNVGLCTVFYFIKNMSSLNCFYCLFSGLYWLMQKLQNGTYSTLTLCYIN